MIDWSAELECNLDEPYTIEFVLDDLKGVYPVVCRFTDTTGISFCVSGNFDGTRFGEACSVTITNKIKDPIQLERERIIEQVNMYGRCIMSTEILFNIIENKDGKYDC